MRSFGKITSLPMFFINAVVLVLLITTEAIGAESCGEWRSSYDIIMKWVNFSILIFLFIKFVKKPLMNFLNLRGEELARDIKKLEDDKKRAEAESQETLSILEKGEAHIAKIKTRIIEQGKEEKEKIINDARSQSQYMLEESKQRVGSQLLQAKQTFRGELVEAAISLAMEKLPAEITEEDGQNIVDNYLVSIKK